MSDFWYGAAIVFFIVLTIISALSWGYDVKESAIEEDCAAYSKFTVNDNVYECKLMQINSK